MNGPVATVRHFYDLVATGDWTAVEAMVDDDFVIHEPDSLPYGGAWRGKDAFQRLFTFVMGFWDDPQVEWNGLVGDDRHVIALLTFTVTARASGRRFSMPLTEVTTLTPSGRIESMRIHYYDTHAMLAELEARAE